MAIRRLDRLLEQLESRLSGLRLGAFALDRDAEMRELEAEIERQQARLLELLADGD